MIDSTDQANVAGGREKRQRNCGSKVGLFWQLHFLWGVMVTRKRGDLEIEENEAKVFHLLELISGHTDTAVGVELAHSDLEMDALAGCD
ncbi:hypothetical protein SKAU_G00046830 [Synaphobranchus kaupii]|uniref:Uncharacterized protein n=1 Tax=Synaphobranchus kaupii TaxID=118154 RepID=A0A9Q1J916_SYNKA|nr:hypothetical protein SKAU_G00046830 [Synaphobranchus kaupii]